MFFPKKKVIKKSSSQEGITEGKGRDYMMNRIRKDMAQLELPEEIALSYDKTPEGQDDLQNFVVTIKPTDESYWHGGEYHFKFVIPEEFPYKAPKLHCTPKIFHPNIDIDGNVCLNILRKDWKPVLTIQHVIFGIETLFLQPNPEDPLNKDAAKQQIENLNDFIQNVKDSLKGTYKYQSHTFQKFI